MLEIEHLSPRDEVLQKALSLDGEYRAFVAEVLEERLTPAEFATPEIAAAWAAEIERRAEACERGEMPSLRTGGRSSLGFVELALTQTNRLHEAQNFSSSRERCCGGGRLVQRPTSRRSRQKSG